MNFHKFLKETRITNENMNRDKVGPRTNQSQFGELKLIPQGWKSEEVNAVETEAHVCPGDRLQADQEGAGHLTNRGGFIKRL